tara:strand:- start:20097 stop:21371 length:1275 start_codon:yes stop_codon:yes gene_type:complete
MPKIEKIRGMSDLTPQELSVWSCAEEAIKESFLSYGFQEIRFPILENSNLFTRSNNSSEMVTKQMYSFEDKGGDSISLRPEGTASCVRAAIENDLIRTDKARLWYMGPMFRYERPQKGRSRQFHQSSAEIFGHASFEADLELIQLSNRIWKKLDIDSDIILEINNIGDKNTRKKYTEALKEYLQPLVSSFDEESLKTLQNNPLRILDTKNPKILNTIQDAPNINDFLDDKSLNDFESLKDSLAKNSIKFTVEHRLVRGLDYYNGTVFEWKSDSLGSQDTVCGGGRYDRLVEELGGKPCPAAGFSIGMERLILILSNHTSLNNSIQNNVDFYFVCLDQESIVEAMIISDEIRNEIPKINLKVNLGSEKASTQFKRADKINARFALILGQEERKKGIISLKNLKNQEQKEIPSKNLIGVLKEYTGN